MISLILTSPSTNRLERINFCIIWKVFHLHFVSMRSDVLAAVPSCFRVVHHGLCIPLCARHFCKVSAAVYYVCMLSSQPQQHIINCSRALCTSVDLVNMSAWFLMPCTSVLGPFDSCATHLAAPTVSGMPTTKSSSSFGANHLLPN
ncbi:hypothetical protein SCLCIDRAFT_182993 [Scleroderma citrinum Foug A]|uniref:Uncharacterized protein n=1 Tax=Scleroderma citrinum Foug A TaxID=1036808 RepID=A0A0C2Z5K1_9AGAM|nr:hypothetical protein SCLCIDRAFT_182993 [Scleroderma citrinum Foug A]